MSLKRSPLTRKTGLKPGGPIKKKRSKFDAADDRWAYDVKFRDDWTCKVCGRQGTHVEAHHAYPRVARYIRWRHDLDNGVTLCKTPCHADAHKDMPAFRAWWATQSEGFAAIYGIQGEVK